MNNFPKNRQDLINMYIKSLEEGNIPWEKMWTTNVPKNGITGIKYNGINNLYLSFIALKRNYKDNRWITYNQMKKKHWNFIKNAKGQGVPVEYWGMKNKKSNKFITFDEYNKIIEQDPDKESKYKLSRMSYVIFNGDLIDGLINNPIQKEQDIIDNTYINNIIKNLEVSYIEKGDEAYYNPIKDQIVLPPSNKFKTEYSYYATQLHELAHSTGHKSRLNRNFDGDFASIEYAKEELRAEISSSFLMQQFHLEADLKHLNNHKAYVKSWLEILKQNPQELFNAISDANKIVLYLEEKSISKIKENEIDMEVEYE